MSRVLIYVQHLLGIGHQRRTAAIARALGETGFDVTYVSGGMAVPGLDVGRARFIQLDPCRAEPGALGRLVDGAGVPVDDAWRARRRAHLLVSLEEARPDALVVEMYPFGRRALRFEIEPLIAAARAMRPRPLIVASVRDILVSKADPAAYAEAARVARRDFDRVLVHGDPALIDFGASFPHAGAIAELIHYTGYVAETPAPPRGARRDGVVVSAGGGRVGRRLLDAAMAARPLGRFADAPWRLLVGHGMAAEEFAALRRAASPRMVVERARPDFPALLAAAAVSVSQAGYNTAVDVLAAGVPAVLVPFSDPGEDEQARRAEVLAARGLAEVVPEADLAPPVLAAAIDRAAAARPPEFPIRLDGAAETARQLVVDLAARSGASASRPS